MAELNDWDLDEFIANQAGAAATLSAALVAARRYCGWTVSPVVENVTLTVDGPGGRVLSLPTRNLIAITALSENGVAIDVATIDISRTNGTVKKSSGRTWTSRNGGITVTMTHGYTESEAADWRRGVLQLAAMMTAEVTGSALRDTADMVAKKVGDVEYRWAEGVISFDERLSSLFAQYRILPAP